MESTLGNLDAAESFLLRMTPIEQLDGKMPSVEAHVYRYLPKADPRRMRIDDIATIQAPAPQPRGVRA